MISISDLALGLIILWKEFSLWYYHRTIPPIMRLASVVPGMILAILFLLFAAFQQYFSPAYQDAIIHDTLFLFFLWNGVVLIVTRGQHNKLIGGWRGR